VCEFEGFLYCLRVEREQDMAFTFFFKKN
jgi:hypothetical protein